MNIRAIPALTSQTTTTLTTTITITINIIITKMAIETIINNYSLKWR